MIVFGYAPEHHTGQNLAILGTIVFITSQDNFFLCSRRTIPIQ